jgi:hypothetical protein
MRGLLASFVGIVVLPGAVLYATAAVIASPCQDESALVTQTEEALWDPPDEPQDRPEPPPPSAEDRPPPVRARAQRPPAGPAPAVPPYGRGGPPGVRRLPPRPGMAERLLPLIGERHPELAEKLRRLRERSPEEFRRVLADAIAVRLEEALERGERRLPGPGDFREGPRPPEPRPAGPEWDEGEREIHEPHMALDREARELRRHNEELERRSHELAQRFRELRERASPDLEPELDEVRHLIERTVEEHFNVRTELRRIELRRVEMELDRLREMVERIRHDLERREEARGPIIENRLRQLLGEEGEGW